MLHPVAFVGFRIAGLPLTTRRSVGVSDYPLAITQSFAERWEDQVEDRGA